MKNDGLRILFNLMHASPGNSPTGADDSSEGHYFRRALLVIGSVFLTMLFAAIVSFFLTVRGAERTLVPQVVDRQLIETLIILQERELYPRIQLKYTGNPADKGLIIQQDPEPGLPVKAGRRVVLTVSQGAVIDSVENYVGKTLNEVRTRLISLSSTSEPILTIREPITYVYDEASPGTILSQNPSAETLISEPTELVLVVSRGQSDRLVKVPNLTGLTPDAAMEILSKLPLSFVFVEDGQSLSESEIRINSQSPSPGSEVAAGTRTTLNYGRPGSWRNDYSYDLFEYMLPDYPVPVRLEIILHESEDGSRSLFAMPHPGGRISFPYLLPKGSDIVLRVNNEELYRLSVSLEN